MKQIDYTPYIRMTPAELRKLQWTKGWALSLVGFIVYAVLRLLGQKPKDYKGICPYFEIGQSWGGVELGWFFICSKNSGETTKMHECGHSIENAAIGGVTMLCLSVGSAARYWWRRIFGAKTPYDSWWFEGDATRIGTEYVRNIEKEIKE